MKTLFTPEFKARAREIRREMEAGRYETSGGEIVVPRCGIALGGVYTHSVNGADERRDRNTLTLEGLNYLLDVAIHDGAKIPTWYLALFGNNVTPLVTWTAASFTSLSGEIVSGTEGYTEISRPEYVESAPVTGVIDNVASRAFFSFATATSVVVRGAGMLSSNAKGGTAGKLLSAARLTPERTFYNTDSFALGYQLELTSL